MYALVTGSAGFVGRHLCPQLLKAGYSVIGIDPVANMRFEDYVPNVKLDLVVHLGANIVDVDKRAKMGVSVFDDIALDYAVCQFVEAFKPRRFIAMSSCAVDFPDDPYGWIKLTLEQFCNKLPSSMVRVLRPFSGYGSDQSLSYPFRAILDRALRREDPLIVWGGTQVRDFIHIDDLVSAICEAASSEVPYIQEVGTGIGTTMLELARLIACEVGYSPVIQGDTSKAVASRHRVAKKPWGVDMISLEEGIRRAVRDNSTGRS